MSPLRGELHLAGATPLDPTGATPPNPQGGGTMAKERRNKTIKARFTETEDSRLKREADAAGISVSQLVRLRAIGKEEELSCHHTTAPKVIVHSADPELLRQIAKIGGNINQIARHLNRLNVAGELTSAEFLDALTTLKALENDLSLLAEAYSYDD